MLGTVNNPGNLEYNPFTVGLGAIGAHGRFAIFPTIEKGIEALARNLINYQDKHGIETAKGVVYRWAPPSENASARYLAFFDAALGCKPDDKFDFRDPDFLYWAITAIGEEEDGHDAFLHAVTDAQIDTGIAGALA